MKSRNYLQRSSIITGLALALALAAYAPSAHANVYATNIKLNGSLTGTTSAQGGVVTITYILNEAALNGTTLQILSGATVVNTINIASGAGTLRGLNTVYWGCTNSLGAKVPAGTYSVAIAPGTSGYGSWTQTSIDSNPGNAATYPWGIDVDRNVSSPYYGRVVMGCAANTGTDPGRRGLYKMNADGSVADEGWFGYANYTTSDGGQTAVGVMPTGNGGNPQTIRIGEDDRIYWCDDSKNGAIVACDILATTNQIVFNEANYAGCPDLSILNVGGYGWRMFDVCALGTTNAALYAVDMGDYPSAGIWMWRLTNLVAGAGAVVDPNDTVGTQVIEAGNNGDGNFVVTSAGIMVDYNLDLFVGQTRNNALDPLYRAFLYTNWNGGVLPPEGGSVGYTANSGAVPVAWEVGTADPTMTAMWDTVINSRVNPTMVAVAMAAGAAESWGYNGLNCGIRVLNATNGTIIATNLDTIANPASLAQYYNGVAFDNVGNVYGASRSANFWRVWSPPGPNTNTTVAVGQVTLIPPLSITHITVVGTTVTIYFTGPASAAASAFTLYSSGSVTAPFTAVAPPATITALSPAGNFQAVTTISGSTQYYRVYGP
jgi:hypothetical protein